MAAPLTLNERGYRLAEHMAATAPALRVAVQQTSGGARIIDCGVRAEGGLQAGLALSRVCLAGMAEVSLVPGEIGNYFCPHVVVTTDQPVQACMASQYAGWQITVGNYFAMGSGPMRAAHGKEKLFDDIPGRERPPVAVGALETAKLPDEAVVQYLSQQLDIPAAKIVLLAAPAASLAGTIQVVARSLEMALHKLHEMKFDLKQVISGFGTAPLPPVAREELLAIGRTNDAILYGGRAVLWVRAKDDELAQVGPRIPSSASPDHGAPFAEIFARYHQDFYKIDPMLFSPSSIVLHNLNSGRAHVFGQTEPDVLKRSFSIQR